MRKALRIYHLINILHIIFYAYILVRALNVGNARAIIQNNSLYILLVYVAVVIGLNFYAKKIGNGFENPMKTVKAARILHFVSIVIFVLAFILFQRYDQRYILLILLSFPIDIIAFIIAYRSSIIPEERHDLIDHFLEDDEEKSHD